jgi:hypothetical protein
MLDDLADYRFHDAVIGVEQIVAAHPRLTRDACSDHDDVGIRGVFVIVCAGDVRVALGDGHGLEQVEPLALRHALDDVDQNNVGQFFGGDPVSRCCTHVARAYDRYFLAHE